jgi:hypothetical protein
MLFGIKAPRHFKGEVVDAPTWIEKCHFEEWSYQPHFGTIEIVGKTEDGRRMVFVAVEQKRAGVLQEITWKFSFLMGALLTGFCCYMEYQGGYLTQTYLHWAPFVAGGIAIVYATNFITKLVTRVLNKISGGLK